MTDPKPPHAWMPLQIFAGRASSGSSRHSCLNFALRPSSARFSPPQWHADSKSIVQTSSRIVRSEKGPLVQLTRESTSDPELEKMAQMAGSERDTRHLMRAIELAGEARGMTSPNPLVGAVVVKEDRVIGEGFHMAAGEPHAERAALEA